MLNRLPKLILEIKKFAYLPKIYISTYLFIMQLNKRVKVDITL